MKAYIKKIRERIDSYIKDCGAAAAVAFGLTIPVLVSAVGVSVDMAQAYLVRERLSHALDAAALAAGAMASDDEQAIEDKVNDFVYANYPSGRIGATYDILVDTVGGEVSVRAYARLDTSFMKIFGYNHVDVMAETTVQREVQGIEVVLVLDNTGSMSTSNNIGALKTASKNFVNVLFERAEDPDNIRIGLVPYSSSVNVGPYGLGLNLTGGAYETAFVEPPETDIYTGYEDGDTPYSDPYGIAAEDLVYNPGAKGQWHGCVLAADYPLDTQDHPGPWEMYRYDHNGSTNASYHDMWDAPITKGDYYNTRYGPNYHCPRQPVVPMTNNREVLDDAIDNMRADGFTLGNYGMVWGWRLISPEAPFTEGSSYNSKMWDKAVLMMTDGDNTMNHAYTAYGKTNTHSIRPDEENERFLEVCNAMKEKGILIYTVTFYSNINARTKGYYEECASDESKYFDAPDQEELIKVFERISRELSNLHIKS